MRSAVVVGKLLIRLCRVLGFGGSNLPGRVARRLCPDLLARLAGQCPRGAVLVTGTNGKTTTARMIAGILGRAGLTAVHNRTGANLITGITSTYLEACDWSGGVRQDIGLLEVDEASVAAAVRELPVRAVVLTNFFRDQLDRFGELEHTVGLVGKGLGLLPPDVPAVLNADDPLVAGLARARGEGATVFYGIEAESDLSEPHPAREVRYCSRCELPYRYRVVTYGHLGDYHCPDCGERRPRPELAATGIWQGGPGQGSRLAVRSASGELELELEVPLPGMYNVYNALAAAACAGVLGLPTDAVERGLATFTASFGRMERLRVDGQEVLIILVKNPAGFNEVIGMLARGGVPPDLLIAINNRYADGTDVSWLWDVDFERMVATVRPRRVTVSGTRSADMAVRLKYAGLEASCMEVRPRLSEALPAALKALPPGRPLHVLPTYTAMLELREGIRRAGHARRYWEA